MKTLIAKGLIAVLAISGVGVTSASASEPTGVTSSVVAPADAITSYEAALASYESALATYDASAKTRAEYKVLKASFKQLERAHRVATKSIEKSFKANLKVAKQIRRAALSAATNSTEKTAARAEFAIALAALTADRDAQIAGLGVLPNLPVKPAGGKGANR